MESLEVEFYAIRDQQEALTEEFLALRTSGGDKEQIDSIQNRLKEIKTQLAEKVCLFVCDFFPSTLR